VGAVVLIGIICLGSFVNDWTIRVRQDAPVSSHSDSLLVTTNVSGPAHAPVSRAPVTPPLRSLSDPLAFLSRAPADSLDLLPGIGPVLAARIVECRRASGGFSSWKEVDAVKGIGPKLIARWQALSTRQ
jgi:competence protein ComEA